MDDTLLAPTVAATAIVVFVLDWNMLLVPLVLTGGEVKTVPVAMSDFFTFERELDWPTAAAALVVSLAPVALLVAAFHRLHERLYTFAQEDTPVEIVTLRVDARGVFPAPAMLELPPAGPLEDARTGTQALLLETGRVEAAIYARERLGAGARIPGPAILTQLDATTLLAPGEVGTVDRLGNLIVEMGG